METVIAKVRLQKSDVQTSKLITVPKKSGIEAGDYVTVTKIVV